MKSKNHAKTSKFDVDEVIDYIFGVANLTQAEMHLTQTAIKTGDKRYLDIVFELAKIRAKHLNVLMTNKEVENYCAGKHLLASLIRFIEMGHRFSRKGEYEKSLDILTDARKILSIFLYLNKIKESYKKVSK